MTSRPKSNTPNKEPERRRQIIKRVIIAGIVLVAVFGVYELGRQYHYWGEPDTLRALKTEPITNKKLLGLELVRSEQKGQGEGQGDCGLDQGQAGLVAGVALAAGIFVLVVVLLEFGGQTGGKRTQVEQGGGKFDEIIQQENPEDKEQVSVHGQRVALALELTVGRKGLDDRVMATMCLAHKPGRGLGGNPGRISLFCHLTEAMRARIERA